MTTAFSAPLGAATAHSRAVPGSRPHLSRLIGLVVVLGCFAYPITTVAMLQLGIPTETGNLLIRAATAAVYLYLLVAAALYGMRIPVRLLPLLAFLGLYGIRLIADLNVSLVEMDGYSRGYVYAYFFGLTALPVLAVVAASRHLDIVRLHRWMLIALLLANLALVYQVLSGNVADLLLLLAGRAQVQGADADTAVLSPLSYGVLGAALAAFALGRLCLMRGNGWPASAALLLCHLLGLINMMLGASRGPFIGFSLSMLVILLLLARPGPRGQSSHRLRGLLVLGLPIAALIVVATTLSDLLPSFLFERLGQFFEDRNSGIREARDFAFQGAWSDFLGSPLIGRHFVGSFDNFYPHNIVLEVLMATGLVGAVPLAVAGGMLMRSMLRTALAPQSSHALPVLLVGVCFLFSGMTSGSISASPEFWIFFALLSCMVVPSGQTAASRTAQTPT